MSLIFDRFPVLERAHAFAHHVETTFSHKAQVFDNQDAANENDPFPFVLDGPIVHVERFEDYSDEAAIIATVKDFDGSFAGT